MSHSPAPNYDSGRRSDYKRKRIMRAAAKVWHRRALSMASMEEIATEAGVSKGTLYNFFRNKEDLFVATVMAPYDDFRENFAPKIDEIDDPRERLKLLIDSLCTVFQSVSDHLNLQHQAWSVIVRDPDARDRMFGSLRSVYAGFYEALSTTLEAGIARGQFRADIEIAVVVNGWISIFDGLTYRNTFDPDLCGNRSGEQTLRACLEFQLQQVSLDPASATVSSATEQSRENEEAVRGARDAEREGTGR